MDIDSVFFSLFGRHVLRARLKPLFKSLSLDSQATKEILNDPREIENLKKFLIGLELIVEKKEPLNCLVTDITHIATCGVKRGYEVCTFSQEGRSLDDWEQFLYDRELHQFSSDPLKAEQEFNEVVSRLDGENRDFLRFDQSGHDGVSFYRWSWHPRILMWAESDGAHRMFKLRYLSKLLNKKIELKNHIRTYSLAEQGISNFAQDNWFLIPDNLETAGTILRISTMCALLIPEYSAKTQICPVQPPFPSSYSEYPYCLRLSFNNCSFRLMRLKAFWKLDAIAKQAGLFSFNDFIAELLLKQKQASLEDFRQ